MDTSSSTLFWYVAYVAVLVGLSGYGVHRLTIIYLYLKHSRQIPKPSALFDELPLVTIQLPIFNEQYVVDRLFEAISKLDYPKDKLQIQIIDDSTDETVTICQRGQKRLVEMGFDAQYLHRVDRAGFKAGALEAATLHAKGEYLFILDADFVPAPDVLQQTIHFFADPQIGMIQTRWGHLNRTYNLLTRVQAMFLDGHLQLEQTARNRSGRFFTFNGTAGIWRKSCIDDAGGWDHDTLTEDMDLSYRAQLKGWKFVFLNHVVTPAELPVDMDGFKSQQHRWTKGSIQVCKKILMDIWRAPIPLVIKLEATAHLTANFAYLLVIVLCFLLYPAQGRQDYAPWENYLITFPLFFFASVSVVLFYMVAQQALRPKTWMKEMLYLPFLLALGMGMSISNAKAVIEALIGHETAFVRTPKYGIDHNSGSVKMKKSSYKAISSIVLPLIEFSCGCFFLFVIFERLMRGMYFSTILLLPFLGFFYTSFGSIYRMLSGLVPEKKLAKADSKY